MGDQTSLSLAAGVGVAAEVGVAAGVGVGLVVVTDTLKFMKR